MRNQKVDYHKGGTQRAQRVDIGFGDTLIDGEMVFGMEIICLYVGRSLPLNILRPDFIVDRNHLRLLKMLNEIMNAW